MPARVKQSRKNKKSQKARKTHKRRGGSFMDKLKAVKQMRSAMPPPPPVSNQINRDAMPPPPPVSNQITRATMPPPPPVVSQRPKYEKLTFLHITKTAGTAIEELGKLHNINWGKNDTNLRDITSDVHDEGQSFWHIPPKYFDTDGLKELLKHSKLFMVVRNPYTRVISEFYCPWGGYKSRQFRIDGMQQINNVNDFNRWIQLTLNKLKDKISSGKQIMGHWTPQNYYLYDNTGKQIVNDENILHFENIGPEFDELMRKNGYSFSFSEIPKINKAESERFTAENLSKENKNLIREIYDKDFELFGYAK